MYELTNEYQHRSYIYSVEVFSNGEYVGWGVGYSTEEAAVNHLKKYLSDIKNLDSDYYKKQYADYSSHPVKVIKKVVTQNWEVYEDTITLNSHIE